MIEVSPNNIFKLVFFFVLFSVFAITFYNAIKKYKRFICPKCGHKQNMSK